MDDELLIERAIAEELEALTEPELDEESANEEDVIADENDCSEVYQVLNLIQNMIKLAFRCLKATIITNMGHVLTCLSQP